MISPFYASDLFLQFRFVVSCCNREFCHTHLVKCKLKYACCCCAVCPSPPPKSSDVNTCPCSFQTGSRKVALHSDGRSKAYVPDFSVRALTDVQYLCITKSMYIAALRTTRILREKGSAVVGDEFETEYEKVKRNENHSSCEYNLASVTRTGGALFDVINMDESQQERVKVSPDRPVFFCKKPGLHEGLYHSSLAASGVKEQSSEYINEFCTGALAELDTTFGDRDITQFSFTDTSDKSKFRSINISYRKQRVYAGEEDGTCSLDGRDGAEIHSYVGNTGFGGSNVSTAPQCAETTAGGDTQTDHRLCQP